MTPDPEIQKIFDRLHVLGKRDDLLVDNEATLVTELDANMAERFGQAKQLRVFDPVTGKVYTAHIMISLQEDTEKLVTCPSCGAPKKKGACRTCGYEPPKGI